MAQKDTYPGPLNIIFKNREKYFDRDLGNEVSEDYFTVLNLICLKVVWQSSLLVIRLPAFHPN